LKFFFKDRDCATLVRPTENESDIQNLNLLDNGQLREKFVEQITQLRSKIFRKIKEKKLNTLSFNGQMFIEMAQNYVNTINQGAVPNI
jgi:hypothetical protein